MWLLSLFLALFTLAFFWLEILPEYGKDATFFWLETVLSAICFCGFTGTCVLIWAQNSKVKLKEKKANKEVELKNMLKEKMKGFFDALSNGCKCCTVKTVGVQSNGYMKYFFSIDDYDAKGKTSCGFDMYIGPKKRYNELKLTGSFREGTNMMMRDYLLALDYIITAAFFNNSGIDKVELTRVSNKIANACSILQSFKYTLTCNGEYSVTWLRKDWDSAACIKEGSADKVFDELTIPHKQAIDEAYPVGANDANSEK